VLFGKQIRERFIQEITHNLHSGHIFFFFNHKRLKQTYYHPHVLFHEGKDVWEIVPNRKESLWPEEEKAKKSQSLSPTTKNKR
jgi:hypothetical protein